MRVKSDNITINTMYKMFKEEYGIEIDEKTFKTICYSYNKKISDKIINDGKVFHAPYRLGPILIQKNKMNFNTMAFDYQEWKKTGIKSYIMNEHSNEYVAKCYWLKSKCVIKNKIVYSFKMVRDNNRSIAKVMKTKNGHQLYQVKEHELKK